MRRASVIFPLCLIFSTYAVGQTVGNNAKLTGSAQMRRVSGRS